MVNNLAFLSRLLFFLLVFLVASCAGRILDEKQLKEALVNEEYDDLIHVKSEPSVPQLKTERTTPEKPQKKDAARKKIEKSLPVTVKKNEKSEVVTKIMQDLMPETKKGSDQREPDYEDAEGFENMRRPISDPFRVGEKVVLDVSYFTMIAGTLTISVKDFVEVNGEKSYHFEIRADTNSFFSRFYSVQDIATTYVNFENLLPYDLQVKVNESKQVKDIRSVFDWNHLKAKYWEKKITKKKEEKKQKEWDLRPWSQNVISGIFYLRVFQMRPEKVIKFHLTDEGKDIMVTIKVLRRENLETKSGIISTLVLNPQVEVDGVFKPMGDIFLWVTDDDRRMIVGIETKIKIGTIRAKLKERIL